MRIISDDVLSVNAAHLEKAFQERSFENSREAEVSL